MAPICRFRGALQRRSFNTEGFTDIVGHAQIARIRRDGTGLEQLTFDERVNWCPHLAPVGNLACYLSYPPGTAGHPENEQVELALVTGDDWGSASTIIELFGGQGTINVNSWSPDTSAAKRCSSPHTHGSTTGHRSRGTADSC